MQIGFLIFLLSTFFQLHNRMITKLGKAVVLVGSLNSRQLGLPLWAGWIVLPFHRAGSEVPEAHLEPGVGAGLTGRTDGKRQSSDSSPGLPAPGDAPGSRAHCGHPGTNHAPPNPSWRPDRGPAARHPGRERVGLHPTWALRLGHLSQATGRDDRGSRPRPLSTAPGRSPRLHEEAGIAPGWGDWPGPHRQLPSRAGESPGGSAGRERRSGPPGPAAPQQDARMPAEAPVLWPPDLKN